MTPHPIDTEALRLTAEAVVKEFGPAAWPDIPSSDLVALLDALAAAEHRATRAEAQSAIRGRAVAIYRERAREAEAQSAAWAKQYEHDMGQENRRADEAEFERDWNRRSSRQSKLNAIRLRAERDKAEARIKAVQDVLDELITQDDLDGPFWDDIRRALKG